MKLVIDSQISTVAHLKYENASVISSHTLLNVKLLIHSGIKINAC